VEKLASLLVASLLLVGCANESSPIEMVSAPPASPAVTTTSTLSIVAPKAVVHGTNPQIAATVVDETGRPSDVTHKVSWSSSNILVVTVSDGHLYSVGPGEATVRASIGEQSATFEVTVVEKSVVSLTLVSDAQYATAGQTRSWSAIAQYNDGSSVDVTADADWSSSDEAIVVIDEPGELQAVAAGMATVSVAFAGQKSSSPFLVQ